MSKIIIVGDFWSEQDEKEGRPFTGAAGQVLFSLMRQVGIERQNCYFTCVFNQRPARNSIDSFCGPKADAIPDYRFISQGKYISKKYLPEIERLFAEIDRQNPNLIIALGNVALWALCKKSSIKKYRGSPLPTHDGKFKVISTWHPTSILRQWELRVIALSDFYKAKRESEFSEIRRPSRLLYFEPTIEDLWDFYEKHLKPSTFISCDIETKERTITEVGFGTADGRRALIVPFWSRHRADGNYWRTLKDEREAWNFVRYVITNHKLVGQNFSYDMMYFWRVVRMPCPYFLGDTMLLHHALQPELEKGLGFLGSIYTNEPSWKFMRQDHTTLKQGDE